MLSAAVSSAPTFYENHKKSIEHATAMPVHRGAQQMAVPILQLPASTQTAGLFRPAWDATVFSTSSPGQLATSNWW
jgi:hypothetical protein